MELTLLQFKAINKEVLESMYPMYVEDTVGEYGNTDGTKLMSLDEFTNYSYSTLTTPTGSKTAKEFGIITDVYDLDSARKLYIRVVYGGKVNNEQTEHIAGMGIEELEIFAAPKDNISNICTADGKEYPIPEDMDYLEYIGLRIYKDKIKDK